MDCSKYWLTRSEVNWVLEQAQQSVWLERDEACWLDYQLFVDVPGPRAYFEIRCRYHAYTLPSWLLDSLQYELAGWLFVKLARQREKIGWGCAYAGY